MDEIFDRIKATKIERKYLLASLIATELLGILVFLWLLRYPLSQKFLLTPSKIYSVESFNPQKRYLVKQQDYLTGRTKPGSTAVLLFTQGNDINKAFKTKVSPNSDGNWIYQLPSNLNEGVFLLSMANLEGSSISNLKNYRIRIASNFIMDNWFNKKVLKKPEPTHSPTPTPQPQSTLHPKLFYVNFEYNLLTNRIEKLSSGTSSLEPMNLNPNPPLSSANWFIYKVVVTSPENETLQQGWDLVLKGTAIQKGILKFQVRTKNNPGGKIKVFSLQNQLLWEGEIPK